jgi:hypothetical protein
VQANLEILEQFARAVGVFRRDLEELGRLGVVSNAQRHAALAGTLTKPFLLLEGQ